MLADYFIDPDIPFVPEGAGFAKEDCGMQCKAQNVDGSLTPSRLCNAAMRPQDRSQAKIFRYKGYIPFVMAAVQWRRMLVLGVLSSSMFLGACASQPPRTASSPLVNSPVLGGAYQSNNDPFETYNRAVFAFNQSVDDAILKPTAIGYKKLIPAPVRDCVSNIFANVADIWTGVNNFLQGKVPDAVNDFGRVLLNTTMGVFGCFDIASQQGVPKHREDFGQTLGSWGVASGPYFVLPFLGSSTIRDTLALPVDFRGDLVSHVDDIATRNSLIALRLIDLRAGLLDAGQLLDDISLDKYSFTRDAFLQRRQSLIYDGSPPISDGVPGMDLEMPPNSAQPGQSELEKGASEIQPSSLLLPSLLPSSLSIFIEPSFLTLQREAHLEQSLIEGIVDVSYPDDVVYYALLIDLDRE